jgi:hypothetical protein
LGNNKSFFYKPFCRVTDPPTVELDVLGRIQPQVEQTRAQFSATTRLRFSHHFVQVLALPRHVRHLSPLCCRTRARHGRGHQKDPVRLTLLLPLPLPSPCVMLTTTTKHGHGRMYLFALQLIQIPLIAVGRTSVIKRNSWYLGNMVFWLGLYAGFPTLCVAYVLY